MSQRRELNPIRGGNGIQELSSKSRPHCFVQRRQISQNIKRLRDIQCYRGKRHIMVRVEAACNHPTGFHGVVRSSSMENVRSVVHR